MVAVEVGLGVALLLDLRRRSVLVPATLLVALFVFLTARTYWRATHGGLSAADAASCGCFGNLVERTPAEAFWQDLLMLVPALALAPPPKSTDPSNDPITITFPSSSAATCSPSWYPGSPKLCPQIASLHR